MTIPNKKNFSVRTYKITKLILNIGCDFFFRDHIFLHINLFIIYKYFIIIYLFIKIIIKNNDRFYLKI